LKTNAPNFRALQSCVPGVIQILFRSLSHNGALTGQIIPCDAQIAVNGFLAFFRVAGLADPMCLPINGGQKNGRIAMGSQNSFQCIPSAVISFLFQGP